jgi:hypothetical protein
MGPSSGHWSDGGIDRKAFESRLEEGLVAEAGVALAALRVEDPERRSPARWSGPVSRDEDLRSLADDIPAEAEPCPARQLEADPGRLADGRRDARDEPRRLEDDEADPRSPSERREPAKTVGDASGALEARREIDHQEIDGPAREERAGHRESLLGIGRGQHDEPLRPDPASDGLDGVEGLREIEPGANRAGRLSLRDESQGKRRPAAREVAPERQAEPPRQAAWTQNRVEIGESGREDSSRISLPCLLDRRLERHGGEGPHDLADPVRGSPDRRWFEPGRDRRRRDRTPLRPEGRQGRRHVGGERRHRRSIEHLFE